MSLPRGAINSVVLDGDGNVTVGGTSVNVNGREAVSRNVALQHPVQPGRGPRTFATGAATLIEDWDATVLDPDAGNPDLTAVLAAEEDVLVIATETYFPADAADPQSTASFLTFTWSQVIAITSA